MHFEPLPEACIPSLESFGHMVTKLRSGQGNPDAATDAAAADATADQSNLYMSPSQATQNVREHNIKVLDVYVELWETRGKRVRVFEIRLCVHQKI